MIKFKSIAFFLVFQLLNRYLKLPIKAQRAQIFVSVYLTVLFTTHGYYHSIINSRQYLCFVGSNLHKHFKKDNVCDNVHPNHSCVYNIPNCVYTTISQLSPSIAVYFVLTQLLYLYKHRHPKPLHSTLDEYRRMLLFMGTCPIITSISSCLYNRYFLSDCIETRKHHYSAMVTVAFMCGLPWESPARQSTISNFILTNTLFNLPLYVAPEKYS